jgi:quercetin dioxygenase-like cupin family protein
MSRVLHDGVPEAHDSPLALANVRLEAGASLAVDDPDRDSILYVFEGNGSLSTAMGNALVPGSAALVLAGEQAELQAGAAGLGAILATVGPEADRHAPLGPREEVARLDTAETSAATGSRSFQILFGPHNGSTRATLFVGFVPPGRAPWHYHQYDEIVWIPEGPGRLHLGDEVEDLGAGAAFRLRPREVHIVENASRDLELTIVGVFTPAGSPAAAYLEPDVAAEYRFEPR